MAQLQEIEDECGFELNVKAAPYTQIENSLHARSALGVKIDVIASRRHYTAHLLPIWEALPPDVRGVFRSPAGVQRLAPPGDEQAVEYDACPDYDHTDADMVIGAAWRDVARMVRHRKTVLIEHGAGQSYADLDIPAYANGSARIGLTAALVPAERCAQTIPTGTDAFVVGPTWYDAWHNYQRNVRRYRVGVTGHWDCDLLPETKPALDHYFDAIVAMRDQGVEVVGHAHPRSETRWRRRYEEAGIDWVDYPTLLDTCSILIADNTSAIWEAAALKIPVVTINKPEYRRHVSHGLRFWGPVPGPSVDTPSELSDAVYRVIETHDAMAAHARIVAQGVYDNLLDGSSAVRAAASILAVCSTR